MLQPLTKHLHPKGDYYGERRLPEFSVAYTDRAGEKHRLYVRGRFLECAVHDHPLARGLGNFGGFDVHSSCHAIKESWNTHSPSPAWRSSLWNDALVEARRHLTATIMDELDRYADADQEDIWSAYNCIPALAKQPQLIAEHRRQNLKLKDWVDLQIHQLPNLAPWLRINPESCHNIPQPSTSAIPILRSAPAHELPRLLLLLRSLPSNLGAQPSPPYSALLAENYVNPDKYSQTLTALNLLQVYSPNSPLESLPQITSKLRRQLTLALPPGEWRDPLSEPVTIQDHLLQVNHQLQLSCLTHSNCPGLEQLQTQFQTNTSYHRQPLTMAVAAFSDHLQAAIEDRIGSPQFNVLFWITQGCLATPRSWPALDRLPEFVGQPIPATMIPDCLAHDITPQSALLWMGYGISDPLLMKLANRFLAADSPPGEAAYLSQAWRDHHLENSLLSTISATDHSRWRIIGQYQRFGWQPPDLVALDLAQLTLPPLPLPSMRSESPTATEANRRLLTASWAIDRNWAEPAIAPGAPNSDPITF